MGLTYFMLQSLRNLCFKRGKKDVCTLCDTKGYFRILKEKYLVLFMESWGCFVVAVMNFYLFYRSA